MNLTPHPTWSIVDSSKLDTFLDCKRQFFYRYILGWELDKPAHDLYFGNAWHHAREYMLLNGYEDVNGAYRAFIDFYRLEFPEETDEIYRPKDPMGVITAILKFSQERPRDLVDNEVLFTEMSGTVPIDDRRVLHYRMDSIMRNLDNGKIFSWDHKSATERSMNYRGWASKFFLCLQNFTYTHCLYCMYPVEDVLGIEFCGTAFGYLKRGSAKSPAGYRITFQRVPAFKTPEQMNVALWNVIDLYDDYERELDRLHSCKESDQVMMAFPMNPNSCTKYYGCQFHDFCMSWQNPLQRCQEPPLGYRQKFWNPAEIETTNKKDLEWRR